MSADTLGLVYGVEFICCSPQVCLVVIELISNFCCTISEYLISTIKIPKMCCSGGLIVILWSDIVGDDGWSFNLIPVV